VTPMAQQAAREAGLGTTCNNPFRSIVVRAWKSLYACEETLRIIAAYEPPENRLSRVRFAPVPAATRPRLRAASAITVTRSGTTAWSLSRASCRRLQNQPTIEKDLTSFVGGWLDMPDVELQHRCEQAIRITIRAFPAPRISCGWRWIGPR